MNLLKITTPQKWRQDTIGKSFDVDNYPKQKYQCFDYFAYFCKCDKMNVDLYCGLTGYVGDLWKQRNSKNYQKYFDFITPDKLQTGDWVFWNHHVAMYYDDGKELGQNQGSTKVNEIRFNKTGVLGGMRLKRWNKQEKGVARYYDKKLAGKYKTTDALNLRTGPGTNFTIIRTLPKGSTVECFGYYDTTPGKCWLYVQTTEKEVGFVCASYLTK